MFNPLNKSIFLGTGTRNPFLPLSVPLSVSLSFSQVGLELEAIILLPQPLGAGKIGRNDHTGFWAFVGLCGSVEFYVSSPPAPSPTSLSCAWDSNPSLRLCLYGNRIQDKLVTIK